MLEIDAQNCNRLFGRSIKDCACRLSSGDGWAQCPKEARGVLFQTALGQTSELYTGDVCQDCGGVYMVRTGTCLTCQVCGSSSGGCS